ncbi:MAG: hypothetical protein V4631_02930 [Pseudomonadota bacterium]
MTSEFNAIEYARELDMLKVELRAEMSAFRAQFNAFKIEVNSKFHALEMRMNAMETALRAEIKIVASEVKLQRWLLGISLGLQTAVLLKVILH